MNFKPGWVMTLFVVIFLPVTLTLGAWQLNRAADKNQVLADYEQNTQRTGDWIGSDTPGPGATVETCIEFTGEQWFLDNRTFEGRVGYDVFLPAQRCGIEAPLLLRLGWVEQGETRDQLPELVVPPIDEPLSLTGQLRPTPPAPWLSSGPEEMSEGRWRFQSMDDLPDPQLVGEAPVLQVLTPALWVLKDVWQPVNMAPERHMGYAIQWFGLGGVLVVGYLIWGIRRSREFQKSINDDNG